jgi:hypothetical protein
MSAAVATPLPMPDKRAPASSAAGAGGKGKVAKDWDWSSDKDVRPLTDLVALLHHPEHPAKLCMEPKARYPLAYIHTWNDKLSEPKYVRTFHTSFAARKTVSGIQYGKIHKVGGTLRAHVASLRAFVSPFHPARKARPPEGEEIMGL